MKVQVIYASRSGCTEKLAEAIYGGLTDCEKSIHSLSSGIPELTGDILLLGYWGVSGGPSEEVRNFLSGIKGKAVGVFCTLGYFAGTGHAADTLKTGIELLKDSNDIIGGYVCNGTVSRELIAAQGLDYPHTPTRQKELRWEMTANHPTAAECALGAELFGERIRLYRRCRELGIKFSSIV